MVAAVLGRSMIEQSVVMVAVKLMAADAYFPAVHTVQLVVRADNNQMRLA